MKVREPLEDFSAEIEPALKVLEQKFGGYGREFLEIVEALSAKVEGDGFL